MRKLLFVCLSLTLGCMGLLLLISARAAINAEAAALAAADIVGQTQPSEAPALEPPAVIWRAVNEIAREGTLDGVASTMLPLLPLDSGEAEPKERPPLLALTFDDGPSSAYTPQLLDGLAERGVLVTFFMVGTRAEQAPELVRRIYEEGHAIGAHSYDHIKRLTSLSEAELDKQVNYTANLIAEITGGEPPFMLRPPYGAINEATAQKTKKANMMWNIDPRDWDVRDVEKVRQYIVENAADGGVVILHDIVATTAEAALLAIDDLQAQGWVFVTLPQLFTIFEVPLEAGKIYRGPTF